MSQPKIDPRTGEPVPTGPHVAEQTAAGLSDRLAALEAITVQLAAHCLHQGVLTEAQLDAMLERTPQIDPRANRLIARKMTARWLRRVDLVVAEYRALTSWKAGRKAA